MDQLQLDEELGRGNYGTVKKVLHKPTNVAMAMKVRLFLSLAPFVDFLIVGDTLRTR
jgi:mitogen-activated protein kinase kinase